MHYVQTTDDQDDRLNADVARLLTERTVSGLKKAINDALYPVWDNAIEALRSDTESNYHNVVIENTRKLLSDVLSGNNDAARTLFACDGYDSSRYHTLIHGHISEPSDVKLRRQLVEAHADLLIDERIKDLNALVENLRKDIAQLENENHRLRNR